LFVCNSTVVVRVRKNPNRFYHELARRLKSQACAELAETDWGQPPRRYRTISNCSFAAIFR
jgi:hypothetical protein